ncbi:hypothetical protein MMC25_000875 [Agyrium rufum]|nr:hypothetical protein [Agyrium rufum]
MADSIGTVAPLLSSAQYAETSSSSPSLQSHRVFVHALNTVKKLPRTGSARPPSSDRLRLYGLYKQSMEGDVQGVMERPRGKGEEAEAQKWDAWSANHSLTRTAAKRAYITYLISTMHRYASSTREQRELIAELEFVWEQVKANSPPGSGDDDGGGGGGGGGGEELETSGLLRSRIDVGGGGGTTTGKPGRGGVGRESRERDRRKRNSQGLRIMRPESEEEVSQERRGALGSSRRMGANKVEGDDDDAGTQNLDDDEYGDNDDEDEDGVADADMLPGGESVDVYRSPIWLEKRQRAVETSLTRLRAEIAALREQIAEAQRYSSYYGSWPFSGRWWSWRGWIPWYAYDESVVRRGGGAAGYNGFVGRRRGPGHWVLWLLWIAMRRLVIEGALIVVGAYVWRRGGREIVLRGRDWLVGSRGGIRTRMRMRKGIVEGG